MVSKTHIGYMLIYKKAITQTFKKAKLACKCCKTKVSKISNQVKLLSPMEP